MAAKSRKIRPCASQTTRDREQGWTYEDEKQLWKDTVQSAREEVRLVPLPRHAKRIVWRLESSRGGLSICDLYKLKG